MKRILLSVLLLLSALVVRAQQPAFGEFFGQYTEREGVTSVELGRKMMQMMSRQSKDDRQLAQLLDGIRSIRILAAAQPDAEFTTAARAVADREPYQLMSSVTEEGQSTRFYFIDGGATGVSEFLMITYGPRENVVVGVVGVFDVKDVSRLSTLRPK